MLKIYMGSRRHWLDLWKINQLMVMPLRTWKVLELQVTGNKENTQQPNIVIFPEWLSFGCWKGYCSGPTQNPHGMSHSGRIWWHREQNTFSALSACFPAPSLRWPCWPYNNKAGFPVCSGESPGVSGNFDLQYILFKVCSWHLVSSKSTNGIRGRFQWFLNALPDPDPLL